ncbi:hypothetical protein ACW6QP_04300 [Salegentibacter sp. HM20]
MYKLYLFQILLLSVFVISCGRNTNDQGNGNSTPANSPPTPLPANTPLNATVKIYFENTLSMDGYINGNTNFKDVFRELLVAVDNESNIDLDTEFFLLNNELTPTTFGVDNTKISEALTPSSTANKGNKGSSNFEEILNTVLQNQKGDVISIVMADFIYSPEKEPDTPSALNKLRTYTQDVFQKAGNGNEDLETRIFSFSSDFNGTYYDINNKHISGIKNRPYYYFVIAPKALMNVFQHNIAKQLKNAPGYQNEALFTAVEFPNINTQILTSTANNGRLKSRGQELEVVSYPNNGNLQFTVLADLSALPLNDNYLMEKDNYHLANSEFTLKDIGRVQGKNLLFQEMGELKLDPSALVKINDKKFTHAIVFTANGRISEDLVLALKKKIPAWVQQAHSADDRGIKNDSLEQSKTFGFGSLVEGVSRAYRQKAGNDEYFKIRIPVK